ncbi:SET domain-containing protein [Auriculariales sp. MPI-PUGE-AT-0066]|nr:SET domain-containing protein [Auriculariales sp. MPI-PUGE-AT-0066]
MGKKTASNGVKSPAKTNGAVKEQQQPAETQQRRKQNVFQKFFITVLVGVLAVAAALMFQRWNTERGAERALYDDLKGKDYPFEMRWVKDKGMGLFATRKINRGDRVITEKPLFALSTEVNSPPEKVLRDALAELSKEDRARYMRLGNANLHSDPAVSIFQTNAVSLGSGKAGVAPTFCRLNHACLGGFNVVYTHRDVEGDIIVQAVRDIQVGEELLTTYTDTLVPTAERRAYLKKVYNFDCECSACTRTPSELAASDKRMHEHRDLMRKFASWGRKEITGKEAIAVGKRIWNIRYNEENPPYASTKGQLLADMAHVCAAHKADMATVQYAEGAAKWFGTEIGHDSQQFKDQVKILSLGPAMHPHFGTRAKEDIEGPGGGAF